ncbi:aldehyde dehydrogenase family protein [Reichenbachiella versicolor]|uniref:aldehyde dehydrogenase family protein n=1 Tax=Reichenbachiella versicolor TaxID=1821036 RepID=UPI000D6E48CE|nr:aldehyde dehydrogenase family protein [Reichenbachiella versicolor]
METSIQQIFKAQLGRALEMRSKSIQHRLDKIISIKKWILNNRTLIHEALFSDLRRSKQDTDIFEVFPVTSEINNTIKNLRKWAKPKAVPSGLSFIGTQSYILPEPKGVCLIIAPWNFPFNLVMIPLITAIAAGNTIIIKPSEHSPATSMVIQNLIEELFEYSDVAVVQGAVEETQELLQLPFNHIFFTGSTEIGKVVMTAAAKHLTSVTLELGGKSPVIVDDSANIEDSARKIVWGRFVNCSQTCLSPDYIFVHESKENVLIDALKHQVQILFDHKNEGFNKTQNYSRLIHEKHTSRIIDMLEQAKKDGAKVEFGGDYQVNDNYIAPTLLSNVKESSEVWTKEIFGPVLPIKSYNEISEVINHINMNPKPLSLYLFSQNKNTQNKISQETSSGSLVMNDVVLQYSQHNLPFGGVNNSGIGKSHGYYGFLDFSNQKSVLKQRIGLTNAFPFYPPFTHWKEKFIEFAINYL